MNSLIYGYMQVPEAMDDGQVLCREQEMALLAAKEGLTLGGIFYEYRPEFRSGYRELLDALERTGAAHVVMPTLRDLSECEPLRDVLLLNIEDRAEGRIYTLDE